MTNEYGAPLDRNGYAPSIMQDSETECYLCGASDQKLDRHEPIGGAYRQKSKRHGLWVSLCHDRCHLYGPYAAHQSAETANLPKEHAQMAAMDAYGWSMNKWRGEFGKNYLEVEDGD